MSKMFGMILKKGKENDPTVPDEVIVDFAAANITQASVDWIMHHAAQVEQPLVTLVLKNISTRELAHTHLIVDHGDVIHALVNELRRKEYELQLVNERLQGKWRPTENENGHNWGLWNGHAYETCRACGLVRRKDGSSNPCKGPTKIGLRGTVADIIPWFETSINEEKRGR